MNAVLQKLQKLRRIFGRKESPLVAGVSLAERIAAIDQSVRKNPKTSTLHRAQLDTTRTSLRRILHKDWIICLQGATHSRFEAK